MAVPVVDLAGPITFNQETGSIVSTDIKGIRIEFIDGEWKRNDTTEYEGIYSEKAKPSFTDSFIYTEPTTGMEIPIHIGLTNDLAVSEFHLTDEGKELFAKQWLLGNWYRYTEQLHRGDVTYEEYISLVAEGKGNVAINYLDEITGQKKISWINPANGVSLTVTENPDLPLRRTPGTFNPEMHLHYHLTLNKDNLPIIATELLSDMYADQFKRFVIEKKVMSPIFFWAGSLNSTCLSGIDIYSLMTTEILYNNGVTPSMGLDVLGDQMSEIS